MLNHKGEFKMKPNEPESLTTEQLGTKWLESIDQMSPKEKAEARKHLDEAFKKGK